MGEPSRRSSRLMIVGIAIGLFGAASGGFLLGRGDPPAPPVTGRPHPSAVPAPAPARPRVKLSRGDLILAASRAADAYAAGQPLPPQVAELAGHEFELRLPFACPSTPQAGAGALSASYDADAGALRARAEPVIWAAGEWLARSVPEPGAENPAEVIEGFWVPRPWTSSEICPPAGDGGVADAPAETTLGIAQIFTAGDSRLGRRNGKAYEAVERVSAEALDLTRGLQLRLRGKLAQAPSGAPVLCRALGNGRPVCLLVASLDQIAMENPATDETFATWDVSRPNSEIGRSRTVGSPAGTSLVPRR